MKITHIIKPRDGMDISYAGSEHFKNVYWATYKLWPSTISWEIENPAKPSELLNWAETEGFTTESKNIRMAKDDQNEYTDRSTALYILNEKKIMLLVQYALRETRFSILFPVELEPYAIAAQQTLVKRIGSTKISGRINLVAIEDGEFQLISLSIPKPDMTLELNYGESFKKVHEDIKSVLNSKDSGLILLHGISGSGKSTYIYHIIHEFRHKMIFIPNNMVESIANPEFVNFLIHNAKNSVLIIEDAEKVLLKRGGAGDSGVSTLLNITDGVLGKILKCKVICTFNIERTELDTALLRKGRLRQEYEFKPLSVEDANKLLAHLGKQRQTAEPLTLAEIYNEEGGRETPKPQVGFSK